MSKKEFEVIKHYDGSITIEELPEYDNTPLPTNPNPTFRERLGKKIRNMPRAMKIVLVFLFDVYGFLYRFSGNRTAQVIFAGFFFTNSPIFLAAGVAASVVTGFSIDTWIVLSPALILWITDLISVALKNDISFLRDRRYKNFEG